MSKLIDKRLLIAVGIFAGYIVALIPAYLIVGWINLKFGSRISYDMVVFLLLVVAIVLVGNIYWSNGR